MSPFRLSVRALPISARSPVRSLDPVPVAVPWRVVRRSLGIIEIEHRGHEPAHQVRFALAGAGMLGLSLPSTLRPGERIRVAVRGALADESVRAHDAMLVMRWFQPDGTELLWPITLE